MRIYRTAILAASVFFVSGLLSVQAQVELQRISTAERSDGQGLVVRYHLSQMADSFSVAQPEINRVQLNIYASDLNTDRMIPISITGQIEELNLYNLPGGMGVDIRITEGIYFIANAYPDVNGRDILLSLRYGTESEITALISEIQDDAADEPPDEIPAETEEIEPETVETEPPPVVVKERIAATFGVKAGISSSNIYNAGFTRQKLSGITFGTTVDIYLPYYLPYNVRPSIETGIYYTQKGFENPGSRFVGVSIEFDYIEIPVLAKLGYEVIDGISPHVVFGPYAAFMVSAERVLANGNRRDLDDMTRETDFGLMGGFGVDFRVGDIVLNVQARGSFALIHLMKDEFREGEKHYYMAAVFGFRF